MFVKENEKGEINLCSDLKIGNNKRVRNYFPTLSKQTN